MTEGKIEKFSAGSAEAMKRIQAELKLCLSYGHKIEEEARALAFEVERWRTAYEEQVRHNHEAAERHAEHVQLLTRQLHG